MKQSRDWVVAYTGKTAFDARLAAIVLRDAGIPVSVDEGFLLDQWAMSQQLMNLMGTAVEVPADQVGRARDVLDAARRDAAQDAAGD